MSSQIWGIGRNGDVVADPVKDRVMTPWTHVVLHGLIWLHASHVDDPEASVPQSHGYPRNAHASRPIAASTAATTNT